VEEKEWDCFLLIEVQFCKKQRAQETHSHDSERTSALASVEFTINCILLR
jgi:hypothetical protein